jgi:hypothetical protein
MDRNGGRIADGIASPSLSPGTPISCGRRPGRRNTRSRRRVSRFVGVCVAPGSASLQAAMIPAISCGYLSASQARRFEWNSSFDPREAWNNGSRRSSPQIRSSSGLIASGVGPAVR